MLLVWLWSCWRWLALCWVLLRFLPLSCSLSNRAFAPRFVLLLIRESEEEVETKAGNGYRAERDLPHHLAWQHTGPQSRDRLFTVAASIVCLLERVTGFAYLLLYEKNSSFNVDFKYFLLIMHLVLFLRGITFLKMRYNQSLFSSRFLCVCSRECSHMGDQGEITCIFHMVCVRAHSR